MGSSRKELIKFPADSVDWARLAAFIDGEGHIEIRSGDGGTRAHGLTLSVGNTDLRLTVWLQETFGGTTRLKRTKGARKCFWEWRVLSSEAASILRECLPYFVMKRDQAEIAIAFADLVLRNKAPKRMAGIARFPRRITEEVVKERVSLMVKLREARNNFTENRAS